MKLNQRKESDQQASSLQSVSGAFSVCEAVSTSLSRGNLGWRFTARMQVWWVQIYYFFGHIFEHFSKSMNSFWKRNRNDPRDDIEDWFCQGFTSFGWISKEICWYNWKWKCDSRSKNCSRACILEPRENWVLFWDAFEFIQKCFFEFYTELRVLTSFPGGDLVDGLPPACRLLLAGKSSVKWLGELFLSSKSNTAAHRNWGLIATRLFGEHDIYKWR